MLEETNTVSIIDYLDIALRRKWFIIIPFLAVMCITVTLCVVLPKVYKASTTILVLPQNVPDDFVKTTVTRNPSEYLNVLSQQIMSRTRLALIIKELSLFPELIEKTPLDDIIALMRKNIEIDVETRTDERRGIASFTLSYLGNDPQTVAATANRLASLFIDENVKSREQQAKKTTEFLSNELKELDKKLAAQEKIVSDFKQRHMGSLPEQREANLRMLEQLTLQRQRVGDDLGNAENRRILIQQQVMQSDNLAASNRDQRTDAPVSSLQARISDMQRKIAALKNKYTDSHPDVIAAKSELKKLQAQASLAPSDPAADTFSTAGDEVNRQRLALNMEINRLQNEDAIIRSKIADYEARVEMAPRLEQELAALSRDYENTKKAYDDLLTKRREAEQAETLEMTQRGEQFQVLDEAEVPFSPFKPNRIKLLLMGFMLALAAGGGAVFIAEYLDQSFHQVSDLETYLELPVLASLPRISAQKS